MTAPIDDVSSLPGRKVTDQEENTIGEIKHIYAVGGDGDPMWVSLEAKSGMGNKRLVFIPLARIKDESGELRVPYSKDHVENTPEVDDGDEISAECERKLRDHYGVDRADQELRQHNESYATLVTEQDGTAQRVEDPNKLETPDADKVDDETRKRLADVGSAETRKITAEDVTHGEGGTEGGDDGDAKSDGEANAEAEGSS
jgi:PRC-barrel domain